MFSFNFLAKDTKMAKSLLLCCHHCRQLFAGEEKGAATRPFLTAAAVGNKNI